MACCTMNGRKRSGGRGQPQAWTATAHSAAAAAGRPGADAIARRLANPDNLLLYLFFTCGRDFTFHVLRCMPELCSTCSASTGAAALTW